MDDWAASDSEESDQEEKKAPPTFTGSKGTTAVPVPVKAEKNQNGDYKVTKLEIADPRIKDKKKKHVSEE